jgi:tetratricopeptide (TPR) repeat protein
MIFRRWRQHSRYKKAIDYFNCGMYVLAAEELRTMVEALKPGTDVRREMLFYLAECYMAMGDEKSQDGDLRGAVEDYEKAVMLGVDFADLHYRTGRAYFFLAEMDNAEASLKKALSLNPSFVNARLALAEVYHQEGKYERELRELRFLEDRARCADKLEYEKAMDLIEKGQIKKGVAIFAKIFQNGFDGAKAMYEKGIACYQSGDYGGAVEAFKELLKQHPDFCDVYNLLGVACCCEKLFAEAEASFKKAIELNRVYVDPRLNLAFLYEKLNHHSKATEVFQGVLEIDPGNVIARDGLKNLQVAEDRIDARR